MLIHLTHLNPAVLGLFVLGLLTLFGRKKKEEKEDETKPQQPPDTQPSGQSKTTSSATDPSSPSVPPTESEDTTLTKLLQSLIQDIPPNPSDGQEISTVPLATPDWVPIRDTPPSRTMVVVSGEKGRKLVDVEEMPSVKSFHSPELAETAEKEVARSVPFAPSSTVEAVSDKRKKGVGSSVGEHDTAKPASAKTKFAFDHIFQITQGALQSPGLVLVVGPRGAGKTVFCSSLARDHLKQGGPCLFVTYDQAPASLRDQMKKISCDVSEFESQFRCAIVDGFSNQSEGFSLEPYYVEKPFELDSLQDALVRNSQIFLGQRILVILDSLEGLASRIGSKELLAKLRELVAKLKELGATFVMTVDEGNLSKEVSGPLEEMADCVIGLEREADENGRLRVRRLSGSASKSEAETFQLDSGKGLVFT